MNALLKIEDIVVHGTEPTVQDLRLAAALGYDDLHKIRNLIVRNMEELKRYGEVSATVAETSPKGGRPGNEYWLNEGQALVISVKSDAKNAPDVREQVIRVFMAWRRGDFKAAPEPLPTLDNSSVAVWRAKIDLVREARIQYGHARAKSLWSELGLPVPAHLPGQTSRHVSGDGPECLSIILDRDLGGRTAREALLAALAGDDDAMARVMEYGLRPAEHSNGFWVSNNAPEIVSAFFGTRWRDGSWLSAIRELEGATPHTKVRFGPHQSRATWFPFSVIAPR